MGCNFLAHSESKECKNRAKLFDFLVNSRNFAD